MNKFLHGGMVAALFVSTVMLVACGGGGGSSASPPPVPGPVTSGLMPASPPPGATLQADATALRPTANGAVYTYRGHSTPYTGATQVIYSDVVTQSISAQSITEAASNSGNTGVDSTLFTVTNGTVTEIGNYDLLGNGLVMLLNPVALKSPVRQGEQYNLIDVHVPDAVPDIDGDGKKETIDLAAYRRVVGVEDVALDNLGTFQAVRVDTVIVYRIQASATGNYLPTESSTLSVWYLAGVGPIRQLSDTPSASTGRDIADERLVRWDGLTAGLGYTDAVPLNAASDAGVFAAARLRATWLKPLVTSFADKAMVVTNNPDPTSGGVAVNTLDKRGAVTSTKIYPGYYFSGWQTLVKVGNSAVLVAQNSNSAVVNYTVLDSNGVATPTTNPPASIALQSTNNQALEVSFAGGVDRVWTSWFRYTYDAGLGHYVYELAVRAFDLNGQWLGQEVVVARGVPVSSTLAASGSNVLLTWKETDAQSNTSLKMAWLNASASSATVSNLTNLAGSFSKVANVSGDGLGSFTLSWSCAFMADLCDHMRGVNIDATGQVRRAYPSSSIDQEILTGLWPGTSRLGSGGYGQASSANRTVFAVKKSAQLWAEDSAVTDSTELRWLDITSSPLVTAPSRAVRFADIQESSDPSAVVWFDDRMLLISNSSSYGLSSTVVWQR